MSITYTEDFAFVPDATALTITSGSLDVSDSGGKRVITASWVGEDNTNAGTLSIANSGTALSWTPIAVTNTVSNCKAAAWWAFGDNNGNRTVTVTNTVGNDAKSLLCVVHTGAHQTTPVPAGNVFSGGGATDVSQSITPTATGSALWMAAGDWNATNTFAAAANCTLAQTRHDGGQYTATFIRPTTQPRADANSFTIGETDTSGLIAWVAFEVQSAGDGSTPLERNLPSFVAKGSWSGLATAATPTMPTFNAGDLLLLVQASANQAITVPGTYTEIASSPQSTGTAAVAGGIRLSVATRIAQAGDTAPTLSDAGNVNVAQIYSFRGIDSASPVHVQGGTTQAATASVVFPTVVTTAANCLVLNILGNDRDIAGSANLTSVTNAGLGGLTVQHDECTSNGVGAGIALITGTLAAAGSTGGTTATNGASVTNASITLALQGSPKIPDWTQTVKNTPLRM